jgi:hypothetical protein
VPEPAPAKAPPERTLPDLDTVLARIPPELAGLLDDLFRARFTSVRLIAPEKPVESS